ncbi:diguanylate cyclase domain-containing protein [Bremerella alba]|uniref:diguanylate cyclase domain-containing protein n=1 Tax=Bremerella alba TaxID=980252 RepID=UPI001A956042|nr:diguanylate cyclase [Bremerella alba]
MIHLLLCVMFFGIGFVAAQWLRFPSKRADRNEKSPSNNASVLVEDNPQASLLNLEECSQKTDVAAAETINEVVERVRSLADGVRIEVHEHSQSVEQINHDLIATSQVSDPAGASRVISRLIDANRHLDSRLNLAEARLQEQSQLLRSHRVEARTDALTGLPNRRVFDEEIERLFEAKRDLRRPSSLVMVDIDHFKAFNDLHGHQAGDLCLKKVGEVIRQTVRGIGGNVMRYGGEEFAVLIPGTEMFDAKVATQRLNRNIERLVIDFEQKELNVTASLGVAEIGRDSDASEWLGRADRALYAAKRDGRNRGCWHDGQTCHEIARRNEDPVIEVDEESSTIARREAFILDVNRRLALFHRKRQPLALIIACIDLIDDKPVEEHPDFVAIQHAVMQVFGAALRDMDHICQLADNQFGALLPAADGQDAAAVAERARDAISRMELKTPTDVIRITISCGVSHALEGDEAEHMLSRSESAHGHALGTGGNAVYLLRHEMDWESPLRVTPEAVIANG